MKEEFLTFILISSLILGITITLQVFILKELDSKNGLHFVDEDVIITVNEKSAKFYARYAILNFEEKTAYLISLPFAIAMKPWE